MIQRLNNKLSNGGELIVNLSDENISPNVFPGKKKSKKQKQKEILNFINSQNLDYSEKLLEVLKTIKKN